MKSHFIYAIISININDNTVGSLRAKLNLNEREFGILIGTVLGDAYIERHDKDARISIMHSLKQKELVDWKYQELKRFVKMQPMQSEYFDSRYGKKYFWWRFQTRRFPEFKQLGNIFYVKNRKIIPKNIDELLKDPISLAVWYMDDGGRRKDCHGMFLNTLSYSKTEQHKLQKCLAKNFGIETRIHWISDGYRFYIPTSSAKEFCKIISPYIIPTMVYKLPYNPVTTESAGIWRRR